MRIGILLPSILTSAKYSEDRIFAPLHPAISLADMLVEKGHNVFFYTSDDVKTKANIITGNNKLINKDLFYYQFRFRDKQEKKYTESEIIKRDFEYGLTMQTYKDALAGTLDIIHSYHDFGAHYFNELTKFPTLYTLHDPLPQTADTIEYHRFSQFKHHNYISISNSQRKSIIDLNFIDTIYHGLNREEYIFNDTPGNYFIYFGRLIEDKGADIAIQAAHQTNNILHIATSLNTSNRSSTFFEEKILPFLNEKITIQGFLKEQEKINFIKNAKAFIFPLRWEEPFGLTVIEAMACGTPVITFNHGSMSELVKDGVTGFVVDVKDGIDGIKNAMKNIEKIDRKACRTWFENNFTSDHMTNKYLAAYRRLLH